jgi:hypothetical protein
MEAKQQRVIPQTRSQDELISLEYDDTMNQI